MGKWRQSRHGTAHGWIIIFTLPDLEGRPHALADYRGKKVFLVFWASW
jgi:peroxiredoxin